MKLCLTILVASLLVVACGQTDPMSLFPVPSATPVMNPVVVPSTSPVATVAPTLTVVPTPTVAPTPTPIVITDCHKHGKSKKNSKDCQ